MNIIEKTKQFVQEQLKNAEGGHDWFHIERVYNNVALILKDENANEQICLLAALLHDVADSKFHNGDETLGPKIAGDFLSRNNVTQSVIDEVVAIIKNMSFKNSFEKSNYTSKEMHIVQDADRLDAIGAIGIARAFNYGGFKNRALFDPNIAPNIALSKEDYKNNSAPTITHFYEKLLLLKDKMNTQTAKRIAAQRHKFMEMYLIQFFEEWYGIK